MTGMGLDWALDHGVAFGIWGGLTEDERRAIRGVLLLRGTDCRTPASAPVAMGQESESALVA